MPLHVPTNGLGFDHHSGRSNVRNVYRVQGRIWHGSSRKVCYGHIPWSAPERLVDGGDHCRCSSNLNMQFIAMMGHNNNSSRPGDHPLLTLLDDYKTLDMPRLKQIYTHVLRLYLLSYPYFASKLLTACFLSPFHHLPYALLLFDQIPQPNLYSWNTLIRANASGPYPNDPLLSLLLSRMLLHTPLLPDNFTFPFAIKAASRLSAFRLGTALPAMVLKSPLHAMVLLPDYPKCPLCSPYETIYRVLSMHPLSQSVESGTQLLPQFRL